MIKSWKFWTMMYSIPILILGYGMYKHFKKRNDTEEESSLVEEPLVGVGVGVGTSNYVPNQEPVLNIGTYGKLKVSSNKNAPLLVVFGGIDVNGRQSGVYMWDYMNKINGDYNIFVAKNSSVDGIKSYAELNKKMSENNINPSKRILYLFSGGYRAGMSVLQLHNNNFSSVYLVDIWMGNSNVATFYKKYLDNNASKTKYYYTSFGATNPQARDYIASRASVKKINNSGHMDTNLDAIKTLI